MCCNYAKSSFASHKTEKQSNYHYLGFVNVPDESTPRSVTYNETENEHIHENLPCTAESGPATCYKLATATFNNRDILVILFPSLISKKDWQLFKGHLNQNNSTPFHDKKLSAG